MRKLKFKYAKAVNFLCFGPDGVEINFESYGNIVSVRGLNLDVNDKTSSNGAGKSSLPEIPVYALYGKTIKKSPGKMNHADVVNFQFGKKLYVEFQWDDYRVVRTRKPDSLRLWKSAEGKWDKTTEITRGGTPATQKYIEEEIIGLNYQTFVNIYIFSDDPTMAFLESDGPTKREIVENLLSLDKYRDYSETAKEMTKRAKEKAQLLTREYENLQLVVAECRNRLQKINEQETQWRKEREQEADNLTVAIMRKMKQLESSDDGAALARYTEAQEQIKELTTSIPGLEAKIAKCQEIIKIGTPKCEEAKKKFDAMQKPYKDAWDLVQDCMSVIKKNEKTLEDIAQKVGGECPYCYSQIEESNFTSIAEKAREVVASEKKRLEGIKETWNIISKEWKDQEALLTKFEKGLAEAKKKLNALNGELTGVHNSISELSKIKEPQVGVDERLIQEQIESLKQQLADKKKEAEGPSPFDKMLEATGNELIEKGKAVEAKREEVKAAEAELPYYEFWVKAFGDKGIRKYVIDGIIPSLNSRIAYWLQFLIDNKIKLSFDNELKETIDRYPFKGRPYVYWGMSGGQRQRLNLTVSQAWAYIMMLNCGCSPSVVWLDEVSKNIDESGVEGIYRMICELAKEKQVFVIDHNPHLLNLLDGCDVIKLEMKDEITRMVS
jgi:DNA repair exonuclease SbcCD ATPase subunit